jgi:hypothetical protein
MEIDGEPMNFSSKYASWELRHQLVLQLELDGFEAIAMGQVDVLVCVDAVIVELFAVEFPPIYKRIE